jgi:hypothetical protein
MEQSSLLDAIKQSWQPSFMLWLLLLEFATPPNALVLDRKRDALSQVT